jgi:hypothetical protein
MGCSGALAGVRTLNTTVVVKWGRIRWSGQCIPRCHRNVRGHSAPGRWSETGHFRQPIPPPPNRSRSMRLRYAALAAARRHAGERIPAQCRRQYDPLRRAAPALRRSPGEHPAHDESDGRRDADPTAPPPVAVACLAGSAGRDQGIAIHSAKGAALKAPWRSSDRVRSTPPSHLVGQLGSLQRASPAPAVVSPARASMAGTGLGAAGDPRSSLASPTEPAASPRKPGS